MLGLNLRHRQRFGVSNRSTRGRSAPEKEEPMNVDLLRLMTVIGRLNPAIWDVIVPMGPRYFESVSELTPGATVELNPQPIPPGHELQFATARAAHEIGLAAIAADVAGSTEGAERIVADAVDDWCGTRGGHGPIPWPRHWPLPGPSDPDPHPWDVATIRTVAALTLASLASRIAEGDARDALAHGAEQLLEAAIAEQPEFATA